MKKTSKVAKIYDDYVAHLNAEKSKRYEGMEEWFHSSAAGLCVRKHYFSSIEKVTGSERDSDTLRLFRLGDVIHEEIQDAVKWYAKDNGSRIFIEKEIFIDDLNVRGFIDLVMIDDGALYDIKSCNSWKWKTIFGKKYHDPNAAKGYMLQTATYAHWYNEIFIPNYVDIPKLKSIALLFYNKDTSEIRELPIPSYIIQEAVNYWLNVNESLIKGKPPVRLGFAPFYSWECSEKYCSYYEACGGGIHK